MKKKNRPRSVYCKMNPISWNLFSELIILTSLKRTTYNTKFLRNYGIFAVLRKSRFSIVHDTGIVVADA